MLGSALFIVDYLAKILSWLADTAFPARCLGCDAISTPLCHSCAATLKPRRNLECVVCKRPTMTGVPCAACRHATVLDQLLIAGHTDDKLLLKAVHQLKYSHARELAPTLAAWALSALARRKVLHLPTVPIITAVPLHKRRLRERGFNQAELLGRRFTQMMALDYSSDVLERSRHTASQVGTHSRWERLDNMRDAFTATADVGESDIILVDDVCTTGATLEECARALKAAGAARVIGLVLARG